jgi:F0F1-type ATP synthase delta subunit
MAGIVQQAAIRSEIQEVLAERIVEHEGELVDFEHEVEQGDLNVVATVQSVERISEASVDAIALALKERLERPVSLEVITLPVVRSSEQ